MEVLNHYTEHLNLLCYMLTNWNLKKTLTFVLKTASALLNMAEYGMQ